MSGNELPDSRECLADAGFTEEQIDAYERTKARGDRDGCLWLLRQKRAILVNTVHEAQRPLDVLDYIMYHVQREGIRNGKANGR